MWRERRSDAVTTAFEDAWIAEDIPTIKTLFDSGQLDQEDATGALPSVVYDGCLKSLRVLLEYGADPNRHLEDWGIRGRCTSFEVLKLFDEHGLDVLKIGHYLLENFIHDRNAAEWLVAKGVDPSLTYVTGFVTGVDKTNKILNETAARGDMDMFDFFVSHGADPSTSIALHSATRCRDPDATSSMIHHLIDRYGFKVDAPGYFGGLRYKTPRTPDSNPRHMFSGPVDPDCLTPLKSAVERRNKRAIYTLVAEYKADIRPYFHTIVNWRFNDATLIELGLEAGAEVQKEFEEALKMGTTPEIVDLFLEFGANPPTPEHPYYSKYQGYAGSKGSGAKEIPGLAIED